LESDRILRKRGVMAVSPIERMSEAQSADKITGCKPAADQEVRRNLVAAMANCARANPPREMPISLEKIWNGHSVMRACYLLRVKKPEQVMH
jgi:hypothetical protein